MMYPDAMAKLEATTKINKFQSKITADGEIPSGDRIKTADKYCAKISTGMLYPLTTEKRLIIFKISSLFFLLNIRKEDFTRQQAKQL